MEKGIARFISVLFHPMLMPTYALILFLNITYFISFSFSIDVKLYLIAFVFIMTFVIPALLIYSLKKFGVIETLQMHQRQERPVPLAMMAIVYYITYYSLSKTGILNIYNMFLLGTTIITLFTLLINYYTKISLHMISMGGISGTLLGLLLSFPLDNLKWLLYLFLILSGVVGYARLTISNHTIRQIYNGFMMGFVLMLALFIL